MLFSFIPLGFAVIGMFMMFNPMLFWRIETQKPSWCRRYDTPDKHWQIRTRISGGFFVVIGILGCLFEVKQFINLLF